MVLGRGQGRHRGVCGQERDREGGFWHGLQGEGEDGEGCVNREDGSCGLYSVKRREKTMCGEAREASASECVERGEKIVSGEMRG